MKKHAIVLAAGSGSRLGFDLPKALIPLKDKPFFLYSLESFDNSIDIDDLILVIPNGYLDAFKNNIKNIKKPVKIITGGSTRFESVKLALDELKKEDENDIVLIHDSARPFLESEFISRIVKTAIEKKAVMSVLKSVDTIAISENGEYITDVPNRNTMYIELTPSAYTLKVILNAYESAIKKGIKDATDDCSLVRLNGETLYFIEGNKNTFKITYKEDIKRAELILK